MQYLNATAQEFVPKLYFEQILSFESHVMDLNKWILDHIDNSEFNYNLDSQENIKQIIHDFDFQNEFKNPAEIPIENKIEPLENKIEPVEKKIRRSNINIRYNKNKKQNNDSDNPDKTDKRRTRRGGRRRGGRGRGRRNDSKTNTDTKSSEISISSKKVHLKSTDNKSYADILKNI